MIRKNRGLRLSRRLVKVFKCWVKVRLQSYSTYNRLKKSKCASKAMSKICYWGSSLKNKAKWLKHKAKWLKFCRKSSGYIRVGSDQVVPKGHLALYVGDKEDEKSRVLVPVIYINHPLFVNLLRKAEMVYGFDHQGGIHIPCEKSQFEHVRMRVSGEGGGGSCCGRWSCMKGEI